jgi:hypothetical protein
MPEFPHIGQDWLPDMRWQPVDDVGKVSHECPIRFDIADYYTNPGSPVQCPSNLVGRF